MVCVRGGRWGVGDGGGGGGLQVGGFRIWLMETLSQPPRRTRVKPYTRALIEPAHTLYVHGVGQTIVFIYFETTHAAGQHVSHGANRWFLGS